jgi:hypothetical protein
VGEDVRPSGLSQHEEHQDEDQSQKVDIDRPDTFVLDAWVQNRFEAEGHGIFPKVMVGCECSVSAAWEPNSINEWRL